MDEQQRREQRRVYNKKYNEQHREEIRTQRKAYRESHKELIKLRKKESWQRNREHNVQKMRAQYRNYVKRARELLGSTCIVCNINCDNGRIHFHEINNTPHKLNPHIYALHADEYNFVPLCPRCHRIVHTFINFHTLDNSQQIKIREIIQKAL